MFSVDWDIASWATIGLEWLHTANVKTEGLLDIVLAVAALVPAVLAIWGYLSSSGGEE